MIRKPTSADYEWIAALNELGHQTPGDIEEITSRSTSYCWVDDIAQTVALFSVSHAQSQIQIAWLLPRGASISSLKRVFKAGFLELADHAELADYEFVGDATQEITQGVDVGERVAKAWRVEFGRANVDMSVTQTDLHWRVSVKPFSEAVRAAHTWEV